MLRDAIEPDVKMFLRYKTIVEDGKKIAAANMLSFYKISGQAWKYKVIIIRNVIKIGGITYEGSSI